MKEKRFVVEVLIGAEDSKTFVIRELPSVPNAPAIPVAVCSSGDEVAQFFDNIKFE